jgi:hypothetical protein
MKMIKMIKTMKMKKMKKMKSETPISPVRDCPLDHGGTSGVHVDGRVRLLPER